MILYMGECVACRPIITHMRMEIAGYKERITEFEKERDDLRLKQFTEYVERSQDDISTLRASVTELEQELTEMTRQRDDYKGNLALIDAELHKRNGECAELRAEVERLKKALKAISDEFDFLGREEPAYLRNIAVQALKFGGDK